MIRYVADFDPKKPSVNAVECAPGAAPDGVADNYVFDTEGEAWERVAREFEAGLALGTRQRRDLLAKIRAVEEEIAQDAEALVAVHKEMEKRGFRSGARSTASPHPSPSRGPLLRGGGFSARG